MERSDLLISHRIFLSMSEQGIGLSCVRFESRIAVSIVTPLLLSASHDNSTQALSCA